MKFLRDKGAVVVLVLGTEGSGKTVGGKYLNPEETVWLNADKKPLSFMGARKMYNLNNNNYREPSTYEDVKKYVNGVNAKRKHERLVFFMLAHVDVYRAPGENTMKERMRTLGKMATKFNIEGAVVHCYYTKVNPNAATVEERYRLTTQNSGFNTARSPEGYWVKEDGTPEYDIQNNYHLIVEKLIEDGQLD